MRIKVNAGVYWCEDCAVDEVVADRLLVADRSLDDDDTEELDDDMGGNEVVHRLRKAIPRSTRSTRTLRSESCRR
jgi:hypothetical protein